MNLSTQLVVALSGLSPAELALPAARFAAVRSAFVDVGKEQGIDPALLAAVAWSESAFDPNVVNSIGATGLMQLIPANFKRYGIEANPKDPVANVRAGARDLLAKGLRTKPFRKVMQGYNGLIIGNNTPEVDAKQLAAFNVYFNRILGRWAFLSLTGAL